MDLIKKRHELLHRQQDQTREEIQVQETQTEYPVLEDNYNSATAELESSTAANRYLGEFCQLWQAVTKRQNLINTLAFILKDQQSLIISLNQDLGLAVKTSQVDQEAMDKMKQEIANSLRMVDATHAREQVAQETIENLRHQITRLNAEMEIKAKMEIDQDGEFTSMAKTKEAQAKEREKLVIELEVMKEKMEMITAANEEFEKKYNVAALKVTELTLDLENKVQETSNELNVKSQLQEELASKTHELNIRTNETISMRNQLKETIKKLHKTEVALKLEKSEKQQLQQKYDQLQQRHMKFQEEFTAQARQFIVIGQKINHIGSQMKKKEEELIKNKGEFARLLKLIELSSKKFEKLEISKRKVENEKSKFLLTITGNEREIKSLKNNLADEKRKVQNLKREKDQEMKVTTRLDYKIQEINKKLVYNEQLRTNQLIDINIHEKTIAKIKASMRSLEKDKERYIEEAKELTTKVEALMEDIKLKTAETFDLKKQILESETQFKQQQNLFDIIRTERNACAKELLEAQDEILEFREKMKVMTHQVEQLKEDISCKETQLTREELAHRKLQSEKEGLRVDLQRWKDNFKESRRTVDALREEVAEVKHAIEMNEGKQHKMRKEMDHIMNERDILGSQLVRRNDEITLLYEKVRILQVTLDRGRAMYSQKLDDIRLLKLEVENLRTEKTKLTKFVNNTTDFRTEIYHLERDLTKERLKSRALEEELQTPLNIHRWRKLEGSDPGKLELIQKIQILQKRLLKGISASQEQEKKLEEYNQKYEALKAELSRQPGPDILQRLGETKSALKEKTKNTKCLMGQVCAFKSEISDLNLALQHVRNELIETKKLYYDQKNKAEMYKKKLDDLKKAEIGADNNECFLPPIQSKSAIRNNAANNTVGVLTKQSF